MISSFTFNFLLTYKFNIFKIFNVMFEKHLFVPSKRDYVLGKKFNGCILCAIVEKSPQVEQLVLLRTKLSIITLNLYPYNVGHLMIFPIRHIEDIRKLTEEEEHEILKLTKFSIDVLEKVYSPDGFNIGWNIGTSSGASISHLHEHVVPRYKNELGFLDIITKSKIMIETPHQTLQVLKPYFAQWK